MAVAFAPRPTIRGFRLRNGISSLAGRNYEVIIRHSKKSILFRKYVLNANRTVARFLISKNFSDQQFLFRLRPPISGRRWQTTTGGVPGQQARQWVDGVLRRHLERARFGVRHFEAGWKADGKAGLAEGNSCQRRANAPRLVDCLPFPSVQVRQRQPGGCGRPGRRRNSQWSH